MAFGVTPDGFVAKRLDDIKTEVDEKLRATFGQSIDLDERGPFGQFRAIFAEREASVWELAEEIYDSQYPSTAEGTSLDNAVSFTGTVRNPPTNSRVRWQILFGASATVVPLGSVISVGGNVDAKFNTDAAAVIAPGVNSIQRLTFPTLPEAGTFTLDFDGEVTAALNWDASEAQIQTALENLVNIAAGNVDVSNGVQDGQVDIEFIGVLAGSPQAIITVSANGLTSAEVTKFTTIADASGVLDRTTAIIRDAVGSVGVWIDIDDSGSSVPAAALAADRQLEVVGANTDDIADDVATAWADALNNDPSFSAAAVGNIVTCTDLIQGSRTDAADVDTGFAVETINQGYSPGSLPVDITEPQVGLLPQTTVDLTAQETGAVQAPAGTLTVIETPVTGWDSATNPLDAEIGQDLEADQDLKLRRLQELAIAGRATTEAIRSKLLELDDVTAVVVFENEKAITDVDGRPPKSVDIVVENGDEDDIAEEIFDTVAAGIETIGDITKNVTDSQGFVQTIKFSRPTPVDIWAELDLTVDSNFYPADGDDQVAAAVVAWGDGLGIGRDIIVHGTDSLEASVSDIAGITDMVIRVGKAALPTSDANVEIEPRETSSWDSSRLTVVQV